MAKRIAHFCLPHPLEKQDGTGNPAIWQWHPSLGEIVGVVSSHWDLLLGRMLQSCHRAQLYQQKLWELHCEAFLVSLGQEAELFSPDVCGIFKGPSVDHSILLCKEIWYGQSLWKRKIFVLKWNKEESLFQVGKIDMGGDVLRDK